MEKRGQFYFVAVMVLVSIFIGFITVTNSINVKHNDPFFNLEDEIKIERRNLLDYVFYNNLDSTATEEKLVSFSDLYINKTGLDKNSVFIFGDTAFVTFKGNRVEGTEIYYDYGTGPTTLSQIGSFSITEPTLDQEIAVLIDGERYSFQVYPGQNLYYVISYTNDGERFTFYG